MQLLRSSRYHNINTLHREKILSAVTEPDWYCCVTRATPTFTKGLEIPITISLTHDKRNKSLAKKLRVKGFVV